MLTLLFCWCFTLFSHVEHTTVIKELFEVKEKAIHAGDMHMFLGTIYPDSHYLQEQKRWFLDAVSYIDTKSFHLHIKKMSQLSKSKYLVEVEQSYQKNKENYSVTYPVIIEKTTSGWKDADSFLYQLKREPISIKYSHQKLQTQAEHAYGILQKSLKTLETKYNWKPKIVEVKLYHNPEWFRQSVKLSLPTWAGGWNEARQAIKLVAGETDAASLTHGLAHEYTHQLVSALTNDNAAYWLQEGAAMYYEAFISGEKPHVDNDFKAYSIKELEKLNLEQLSDENAGKYYLSCYIQFRKLLQRYGEAGIKEVFTKLSQFPFIDLDSSMKQKETNYRTNISLQRFEGSSKHYLDKKSG